MTTDPSPTDGATPPETETVSEPLTADQPRPAKSDITAASETAEVEKLAAELAREPQPTADTESAAMSNAVIAVSGAHRPGLAGFAMPELALTQFAGIQQALLGPSFNQFDAVRTALNVMTTSTFTDIAAVAGLSRANDIVSALSSIGPDFSALSALSAINIDTRPALLDALATVDVSAFKHAHLGALAESFSVLDVTPTLLGGLAANAGIADTLARFVEDTHGGLGMSLAAQFGEQMLASVDTREWLLMAATTAAPARNLVSARPLTAFDRYLDHLPLADVDEERARMVLSAGRTHGFTVDALVAHDALMSPMDADDLEEVIEVVQGEVVEPWLEAREEVAGHLRSRLGDIDPKLAELYVGAWDSLAKAGPGYLEASCHLANEALGRVMHQLAPDDQVRAWASTTGVPAKEVESSGKLTRKIRLRYILRDASRDERRLLINDVEAILSSAEALVNRFNAGKHASTGTNVTLRANLMTLEGVLTRILP